MLSSSEGGYTVIGEVPRSDIAVSFRTMRNTIVIISLICIMVAILIPSLFIRSFARRTKNIIVFMRKVKNGDFNARIHDFREDELGQISKSFNSMLDELNEYIDRVYKAEINQKQTELAALQARVNPHFLYNTLEVIRMRAFSQGANDAAEMIYSLSVLFKSLVLRQENYTLHNELEACQQYLELFRIRYKNKFSYEIVCPPELRSVKVMKLSLQPIIENYIVHGIRSDRNDNLLTIRIRQQTGNILAVIEDNGKGIEAEALVGIRQRLDETDESDGSFGIRSVQARLNLLYGKPYGMDLESIPEVGTKVTILFPDTRERVEKLA
jgi:two-component system sensor histidine kinase YesM